MIVSSSVCVYSCFTYGRKKKKASMNVSKRRQRELGMLGWNSNEHFTYFYTILAAIRWYNLKTFMAVWREVIFDKREKNKPHLSLMIYQIHSHKSQTRILRAFFNLLKLQNRASLPVLCPPTEVEGLSFVGWDTLG